MRYQTENGLRKNCGSPHKVRAQKRHTYFLRVSAIFAIFAKRHTYFVRVSAIFAIFAKRHTYFVRVSAIFAIFAKRHTYFVRVSAIFANQFCLGIVFNLPFGGGRF
jgi:hypothetical protein